jgi:UDP-4-amino-4,6-dideoxy-N-acetyl-beta-L-altrosamine N-acetyltransferase
MRMISLRDVVPEDKDMIRNWRNLPEVRQYMYTDHEIGAEEHTQWFQGILRDPKRRYWVVMLDGEPVGLFNLADIDHHNKRCYWGFYVANVEARGRGVASFVEYAVMQYVFEELRFNKLCGEVLASNELSLGFHKSFGFVEEGHLRQHVIKGGKSVDVVVMGMLREEWEAQKPEIEARLKTRGLIP